ncbi:MAG: phosphonate ABC transporter, permease protein PhnE [Allorhizobium sp.]
MRTLDLSEMENVAARHPALLQRSFLQRFRVVIAVACLILYMLFCWWFFSFGKVLGTANWTLAGNYLADWVSYEVRPDIDIAKDGTMQVVFPRYSPLGDDPHPDWIDAKRRTVTRTIEIPASSQAAPTQPAAKSAFSFVAPSNTGTAAEATTARRETVTEEVVTAADITIGSAHVNVADKYVTITFRDERLSVALLGPDKVKVEGALPVWAEQARPDSKVMVYFGFAGWLEIRGDAVKIHHRFFGWENFVFDTQSPFFEKSLSQVTTLVMSDERIDPGRSNLSLAWNNILYNSEWQHLDVWTKLLQTIVMAFVGTLFAMIVAFPLSFLAARNILHNRPINQILKRFFDFQRSVDMLIWALFFTRAFGPGPLAGISAIFFTDTGTLGKLYSEALENIDDRQREGVKSVGAPAIAVQRFGVLPQVLPLFASQALYFWESNTRSATIIGAVGAGGIGLKLWEAMRTNSDWENVAYMVVLILIVVFLFDALSNALRSRLMGTKR